MIYLVFVVAALTRFLMNSHLPGFSPVFGALLFSGARLRKRDAIWFPVVVLAIGDWILTTQVFHMEVRWGHAITLVAFAAMAWIGGLLRQNLSVVRFAACAVAASTVYFMISNFGVWLAWGVYPHTRDGLVACYVAALPYYRTSSLSTLLGGAVLFGGYEFLRRRHHDKQLEPATSHAS
ncbi:MAG: hypothetical protein DMG39_27680 [Acidobacteria bacterium]|nr:MAG: hypothetical protein DMG39_27680 [Acidobacteriota bacterium]